MENKVRKFIECRNPVLPPDVCIPDGEAHEFDGRLYVYGSCDQYAQYYCSHEYYVLSTGDMHDWTVHHKALDGRNIPWIREGVRDYPCVDMDISTATPILKMQLKQWGLLIDDGANGEENVNPARQIPEAWDLLYAPDCAYRDGKYYLYFCTGNYREGVAVSDRPEGPFENPVQLPCGGIDPAVFIDDDGRVYYYWGQFRASAVELNPDMCTFDENKVVSRIVTEEEHGFHEGSSMRKHNGIYYYVYPCVFREGKPTCLAYATSDSPLGPFTYRGIIIDNAKCDPQSWNIHGSIQCFRGQWYVFYHRSSKNSQLNRRLCVEPITINPDGTIDEVKMTSIGAGKPFRPGEQIRGWRACEVEGGAYVDGYDLVMKKGSKAVFRYIQTNTAICSVQIDQQGEESVHVLLDDMPATQAQPGLHEITLVSDCDTVVHSICLWGTNEG